MKRLWLYIPLAILLAILGVIFVIYNSLEYERESPMVGQALPSLILPGVGEGEIDVAELKGHPYLLHIGASWCETCASEHEVIQDLSDGELSVVGVFYKDTVPGVEAFLAENANPYDVVLLDSEGRALVNLGGMALPTSYLVNEEGVIEAVFSGPLSSSFQVTRLVP